MTWDESKVKRDDQGQFAPWRDFDMPIGEAMALMMANRLERDSPKIQDLAASIAHEGVRERLQIEDSPRGMFLGDGHHRLLAASVAGLTHVPVRLFDASPEGRAAANRAMIGKSFTAAVTLTFEQAIEIAKARDKAWWEANGHGVARDSRGRFARKADISVPTARAAKPDKPKALRKPRAAKTPAKTVVRPEPKRGADVLDAGGVVVFDLRDGSPERDSLNEYRGMGFQFINKRLRSPETPGLDGADRHIANIDRAMESGALRHDVEVVRGISEGEKVFGARFGRSMKGAEWTEQAYVSTTADQAIGEWFSGYAEHGDDVRMRIRVPAGTKTAVLSTWGGEGSGSEAELLLQRGLRMRVTGDTGPVVGAVRWLDVEVVPA